MEGSLRDEFCPAICAPTVRPGDDVARVVDVVRIVACGADHDVGACAAIEQIRSCATIRPVVASITVWAIHDVRLSVESE